MAERDVLEVDILIIGGGPAGLSAALRLSQLQRSAGGAPLSVTVLEKGREIGAHSLSGAILDESALRNLVPDFRERGAPVSTRVAAESLHVLTAGGRFKAPFIPRPLANHGHAVISLNAFVKWLGAQVEAAGIDVLAGVSAADVLREGTRVVGVRTRDLGRDRNGAPKATFEPGVDVRAKVTIFCDGVRGNLTKQLVRDLRLDAGRQAQLYALGLKELWELPPDRIPAGTVMHTLGYPLNIREFGGGFLYGLGEGMASVGLVVGLDYEDPGFDPYVAFQRFKQHPFVTTLLDGGTRVRYGAKALPEGGWHTIPRVHMDGALIAGDAGGFLDSLRLKGVHLAMRTGMLAAESAFDAIAAGDTSASRLESYQRAIDAGTVKHELYPARNVHQAFQHGLLPGLAFSALSMMTGGGWLREPMPATPGHLRMRRLDGRSSPDAGEGMRVDRRITFDRPTSVHASGTRHREDEPVHLLVHDTDICRTRCTAEYGNPCTRFCPANVYEMVEDAGGRRLQINASNCVHCRTCDIMDPYQIIDWVPPEGGEGPQYEGL